MVALTFCHKSASASTRQLCWRDADGYMIAKKSSGGPPRLTAAAAPLST